MKGLYKTYTVKGGKGWEDEIENLMMLLGEMTRSLKVRIVKKSKTRFNSHSIFTLIKVSKVEDEFYRVTKEWRNSHFKFEMKDYTPRYITLWRIEHGTVSDTTSSRRKTGNRYGS